jgi:hypothetical protein
MIIKPTPPTRQSNLSLHLTASELPEPSFSTWLTDPSFQAKFRQAYALGGAVEAQRFARTWATLQRKAA